MECQCLLGRNHTREPPDPGSPGTKLLLLRAARELDRSWPLCAGVVDVCLIPEVPFELDRLLDHVAKIVDKRGHVVICTAEGAGQVHRN